jgi:hypothetical protein
MGRITNSAMFRAELQIPLRGELPDRKIDHMKYLEYYRLINILPTENIYGGKAGILDHKCSKPKQSYKMF